MQISREENLKNIVMLSQFGEQEQEYTLASKTEWLQNILKELKEELGSEAGEQVEEIKVDLKIKRLHNTLYGEHLVVRTSYRANYHADCVRCLKTTPQNLEGEIAACFINSHFENDEEYADITDIFVDNEEMELCFHKKGKVDLAEFIREQFMIDMNPLPLHDPNCKGLCQICGEDRNSIECGH